jgi:hypothetical protein
VSCFVRIATRLTDLDTIREAVPQIGYRVVEGTEVRGWSEQTTSAELVIGTDADYDIGAVRGEGGGYDFVADWSMARVDQQEFVARLAQRYSYLRVTAAARKQGFVVAQDRVDEQGRLQLVLRKFA